MADDKKIEIQVVRGPEGLCLLVDDRRVSGPKPWGGGSVIATFKVDAKEVHKAIGT